MYFFPKKRRPTEKRTAPRLKTPTCCALRKSRPEGAQDLVLPTPIHLAAESWRASLSFVGFFAACGRPCAQGVEPTHHNCPTQSLADAERSKTSPQSRARETVCLSLRNPDLYTTTTYCLILHASSQCALVVSPFPEKPVGRLLLMDRHTNSLLLAMYFFPKKRRPAEKRTALRLKTSTCCALRKSRPEGAQDLVLPTPTHLAAESWRASLSFVGFFAACGRPCAQGVEPTHHNFQTQSLADAERSKTSPQSCARETVCLSLRNPDLYTTTTYCLILYASSQCALVVSPLPEKPVGRLLLMDRHTNSLLLAMYFFPKKRRPTEKRTAPRLKTPTCCTLRKSRPEGAQDLVLPTPTHLAAESWRASLSFVGFFAACGRPCAQGVEPTHHNFQTQSLADAERSKTSPKVARGKPSVFRYATQISTRPPHIALFCTRPHNVHLSYLRFLKNQLDECFSWTGTPIRFSLRCTSSQKKDVRQRSAPLRV